MGITATVHLRIYKLSWGLNLCVYLVYIVPNSRENSYCIHHAARAALYTEIYCGYYLAPGFIDTSVNTLFPVHFTADRMKT